MKCCLFYVHTYIITHIIICTYMYVCTATDYDIVGRIFWNS